MQPLIAPTLLAFYSFTIFAPFSQTKSVLFTTISELPFMVAGWKHISAYTIRYNLLWSQATDNRHWSTLINDSLL